ncbi:MAG: hypothetical protein ACPLKX_08540 [Dictyoglomaceae bacterium]
MNKRVYYFLLFLILTLVFGNAIFISFKKGLTLKFVSIYLDLLESFFLLLTIILIFFITRMNLDEKNIFKLLGIGFLLLFISNFITSFPKYFSVIPSEILFLVSFFLPIKPYLSFIKKSFLLISTLLFIFLFSLSYFFIIYPLLGISTFSIHEKIFIIGSLLLDSLIIFLLIPKILLHLGGEYEVPWLSIGIGFLLKFIGSLLSYYYLVNYKLVVPLFDNFWIFWTFFVSLGVLEYIRIYST